MKQLKPLAIFLAAILLLSFAGCGGNSPEETPNGTEPASAAPQSGGQQEFTLEELPEIGEYTNDEKVQYFFEDGPHDVFEPRPDYGRVIPYISQARPFYEPKTYSYYDDDSGEDVTVENEDRYSDLYADYGLMTADGKIITTGFAKDFYCCINDDGAGYYAFLTASPAQDEDPYAPGKVCYIGLDGSWQQTYENDTEDFFLREENKQYIHVFSDDSLLIYDLSGQLVFRLKDQSPTKQKNLYDFEILYEDKETLIINNKYTDEKNETDKSAVTVISSKGEELHHFEADGYFINYGKILFHITDEGYTAVSAEGKALDGNVYQSVYFSEPHQLYLAVTGDQNNAKALYFDKDWNPVQQKNVNWPKSVLEEMSPYEFYNCNENTVYWAFESSTVYDFYGNAIQTPAGKGETDSIEMYTDYSSDESCILVTITDGSKLLCDNTGKCIKEMPPDKYWLMNNASFSEILSGEWRMKTDTYIVEKTISSGALIYIDSADDLHVIALSDGEEQTAHLVFLDEAARRLGEEEDVEKNIWFDMFGADMLNIYYDCCLSDDENSIDGNVLYSVKDRRVVLDGVQYARVDDDYWTVYAWDVSYVFTPDGELLLKLRNDEHA